jgi:hypothetical protein
MKAQIRALERQVKEKPQGIDKAELERLRNEFHKAFEAQFHELQRKVHLAFKGVRSPAGPLTIEVQNVAITSAQPRLQRRVGIAGVIEPKPSPKSTDRTPPPKGNGSVDGGVKLDPTSRAILKFLGERAGSRFSASQIAVQTRYSRRSSTFSAALRSLVKLEVLAREGEDFAVPQDAIQMAEGLLGFELRDPVPVRPEDWLAKLPKAPRRMFEQFLGHRSGELSEEDLAERTDYSITSSNFSASIRELVKLGLVERTQSKALRLSRALGGAS